MADLEKPENDDLQSPMDSIDSGTTANSERDLERATTAADGTYLSPAASRPDVRTASRSIISRTRTGASVSDGYAAYNVDDGDEEDAAAAEALAVKRTPTDAYEVRWDGKNDPMSPRNMGVARKWLITCILSFSSFLVYVCQRIPSIVY